MELVQRISQLRRVPCLQGLPHPLWVEKINRPLDMETVFPPWIPFTTMPPKRSTLVLHMRVALASLPRTALYLQIMEKTLGRVSTPRPPLWQQPSPTHRMALPSVPWAMVLSKPVPRMEATRSGTTAPTIRNPMRPTASCSLPTVWIGMPCSSRATFPSLKLARPQLLIIRRHSRTLCPVMIFLFLRLMAHTVRTATLKSGTRMALARSSMISPDMPHLVVTIRSSRIPAAVSGTQFRAMPLSTANPSTRTVSLSMTTENSARPMWKPFVPR